MDDSQEQQSRRYLKVKLPLRKKAKTSRPPPQANDYDADDEIDEFVSQLSGPARNREESRVQSEHLDGRQDGVQTSNNSRSGPARNTAVRLVKFVYFLNRRNNIIELCLVFAKKCLKCFKTLIFSCQQRTD